MPTNASKIADLASGITTGGIGIQSAGTLIGGTAQLNFIGAGNTFAVNGNSIDISISGSGSGLTGVNTNFVSAIGIQSAGTAIGVGITQLNFIGVGNTFAVNGTSIDISISGSGGGSGGSVGISSGGSLVGGGITDIDIAFGSTTSRNIVATGTTASIQVQLGDYYIFRKPEVGFATMKVLVAGAGGGIAKSDYLGGSLYTGMTTSNTDQFPWVAGIGITISSDGHLMFTVP